MGAAGALMALFVPFFEAVWVRYQRTPSVPDIGVERPNKH